MIEFRTVDYCAYYKTPHTHRFSSIEWCNVAGVEITEEKKDDETASIKIPKPTKELPNVEEE